MMAVIFIPAGKWHNLINTGCPPQALLIYAPPEHPHGTFQPKKEDMYLDTIKRRADINVCSFLNLLKGITWHGYVIILIIYPIPIYILQRT